MSFPQQPLGATRFAPHAARRSPKGGQISTGERGVHFQPALTREAVDPAAFSGQDGREAGVTARSRRSQPSSVAVRESAPLILNGPRQADARRFALDADVPASLRWQSTAADSVALFRTSRGRLADRSQAPAWPSKPEPPQADPSRPAGSQPLGLRRPVPKPSDLASEHARLQQDRCKNDDRCARADSNHHDVVVTRPAPLPRIADRWRGIGARRR